jgi:hypothetical protein
MGRILSISRIGAAVLLLSVVGTGGASAQDAKASKSVDVSNEYIKDVQVDGDDVSKPRRKTARSIEPRVPDEVVVPEPGTIALVALGIAGLGIARRKK